MSKGVELYMARVMLLLENKNLRQQLVKFVITGFCGLFTDVAFYRLMVKVGLHVTPAKAIGCICGTIVVFFINRAWTFASPHRSSTQIVRFALLYATTITLNTTLNTIGLRILPHPWQVAFVFAAAVTTMINFVGSKFVVFKPQKVQFAGMSEAQDFAGNSPDTAAAP